MSHVPANYSEMQTLSAVEGLQEANQQQQQTQHQMTGIQTPQTRITNSLLRVIPSKLLNSNTNPFSTQPGHSVGLLPTAKVAIIGSQHQQLPMSAHSNNNNNSASPYIVTLTNNNNNNSNSGNNNNAVANAGNPHFQQIKNSTQMEGYHYMDETSGHIIYQPSDSLQQNSIYVPQQTIFYTNANGAMIGQDSFMQHQDTVQQLNTNPAGNKTFIIQQDRVHEGDTQFMTGGPRASPATLRWLLDNIEEAEAVSLPRSTLYGHYLRHCDQLKLEPMNQASFGKLIRSVFTQIRTRRLGTRGNSKYHYYGIQIKSTSKLNTCDYKINENENYDDASKRGLKGMSHLSGFAGSNNPSILTCTGNAGHAQLDGVVIEGAQTSRSVNNPQEYFKNTTVSMPNFGKIEPEADERLPEEVFLKHLAAYEELYAEHCEAIITSIVGLQFNVIESFWKSFWRTDNQSYKELEATLPQKTLYALSEMSCVQRYTARADCIFYQLLVEILIPDVLKPIPSSLTQVIRNFAKNLESSLRRSMGGVCEKMVESKVSAAKAFAQILRRYTSLNHLAQAARAVLQNPTQVTQMLTDLNRVDFNNIQEQGYWVCGCNADLVKELESDLKKTLEKQSSLEEWANWLEGVVDHVLKPVERHSNFIKIALKFLLNWSFYCLMVIRDLTLRSAASFGSFHLIHLLFDEYMFFLVERKVAEVRGETPIAVVSCKKDIDERFEELISRSQLELYMSASSHRDGNDFVTSCPTIKTSVKQEFSSTLLPPSLADEAKESKKELETFSAFFNPESTLSGSFAGSSAPVTSTSAQENKRNLKITNVLSSNGKMVVFVPSIESRNSLKRLKPDFKP